jgi:hypothetical protein
MELLAWERMICGPRIFGKQAEDWPPVPVPFHCVLSEFFAPKARTTVLSRSAMKHLFASGESRLEPLAWGRGRSMVSTDREWLHRVVSRPSIF